jgi:hypothetical protein
MKEPAYRLPAADETSEGEIVYGPEPGTLLQIHTSFPYIGQTRSLNSNIIIHPQNDSSGEDKGEDEGNETHSQADDKKLRPMLAFAYLLDPSAMFTFFRGTVTGYTYWGQRFSDFSLLYNGSNGIFEQFYRPYDNILRNSMHSVTASLLLSQRQKLALPSFRKILLYNQELLPDKLNFTIGGKNEPEESGFFTLRLYEPVNCAIPEAQRLPVADLVSRFAPIFFACKDISEDQYDASPYKTASIPTLYVPFDPPGIPFDVIWEKQFAVRIESVPQAFRLYTVTLRVPAAPAP